ncbi:uracil-DNA glycosylase, partial [Candidatus Endoriftia persephone str. Guaymas]|nr:uracil-DNA glycosylase [Candidatus Endoriftia persephone str. Guaymas]
MPNKQEITHCADWMRSEFELLQPRLLIPVGKLAIEQFCHFNRLTEVIGRAVI